MAHHVPRPGTDNCRGGHFDLLLHSGHPHQGQMAIRERKGRSPAARQREPDWRVEHQPELEANSRRRMRCSALALDLDNYSGSHPLLHRIYRH